MTRCKAGYPAWAEDKPITATTVDSSNLSRVHDTSRSHCIIAAIVCLRSITKHWVIGNNEWYPRGDERWVASQRKTGRQGKLARGLQRDQPSGKQASIYVAARGTRKKRRILFSVSLTKLCLN